MNLRLWLFRVLALLAVCLSGLAAAVPRVGQHDGYTRLVFDLPAQTSAIGKLSNITYTISLGKPQKSESGQLNAPGVSRYQVSGTRVVLTLSQAGSAAPEVQVFAASGSQPARLVVDVPLSRAVQAASATPATASPVVRPASLRGPVTVVIDPGHGGVYPGMSSQWIVEKAVTLDVALRVRTKLQARGVKVIMTRSSDTQISTNITADLDARSRMANNSKVGAFVSIHVNAGAPSAQGIETYFFGAPLAGSNRSLAVEENGGGSLGETLTRRASNTAQNLMGDLVSQAKLTFSRELAAQVQARLIQATGAVNRGVRSDAFYVIRNPTTPAILTEIGFGSSPDEGPRLALPAYRDRVAGAIADAIATFLHTQ